MDEISLIIRISNKDFELMKYNDAMNNPVCPLSQKEIVCKIARGVPIPTNPLFVPKKIAKWKWELKGYNTICGNIGDWHCTLCNKVIVKNLPKGYACESLTYKYCPYCGAEIRGIIYD